jgi:hypothetical protein
MAPHHKLPFVYTPYTVLLAYAPFMVLAVPGMSAASSGARCNRWVRPGRESRSSVQGHNELRTHQATQPSREPERGQPVTSRMW